MKEVISVIVDEEFNTADVTVRVPDFQNFGEGLAEIERKLGEVAANYEPPEITPGKLAEKQAKVDSLLKKAQDNPDTYPGGLQKALVELALAEMGDQSEFDGEEEEDEYEEDDDIKVEPDLQELMIQLPAGIKWDKTTEAVLDQFLVDWNTVRPVALKALFNYYQETYRKLGSIFEDGPGAELRPPKPSTAEVAADHFYMHSIHLHSDGALGLEGGCTWDEEHGIGVLIRDQEIISVGLAEEAYE